MRDLPRFDCLRSKPGHLDSLDQDEPVTIVALEECPWCEGTGVEYEEVRGGRYNRSIGTWEPDERPVECSGCEGFATVETVRCTICGCTTDGGRHMPGEETCECDNVNIERENDRFSDIINGLTALAKESISMRHWTGAYVPIVAHGLGWNMLHRIAARYNASVQYADTYTATTIVLIINAEPYEVTLFAAPEGTE